MKLLNETLKHLSKKSSLIGCPMTLEQKDYFGPNLGLLDPNFCHNFLFYFIFF